ncbi:MAG: hypothetical protein AB7R69_01210 [Candidatus Babeliales bacterium]
MFLAHYKNFALVVLLSSAISTTFSSEKNNLPKQYSSTDWYFNVRANINAASIMVGTWAAYKFLFPITICTISDLGRRDIKSSLQRSSYMGLWAAFHYAVFAVALQAVDKVWLRSAFYKSLEEQEVELK